MKNLITSNINLLHSNSIWRQKNHDIEIDKNYNNFFLVLNNQNILKKYDNLHIILHIDRNNCKEIINKIKNIGKLKKNNFILYFFIQNQSFNDSKIIQNLLYKFVSKFNENKNGNIFFKFFDELNDSFFDLRNRVFLKFPFNIKSLIFIKNKILLNIKQISSKPYKLIILDCDNTLWGGVLDEDKYKGINFAEDGNGQIFYEFQKELKELKNKGFLLSISSKNTEKKVWEAMKKRKMILNKEDFISPKINWMDKGINIKKTLSDLSLRAKDAIFIDDNFIELKKVSKQINGINTINFNDPIKGFNIFKKDPRLQKIKFLKEDLKKYHQYKLKSQFEDQKKNEGISINFFKNLKQKIIFSKLNNKNFNRAIQLFNKTNQFNFSLNRYTNSQLEKISKNKKFDIKLFEMKDKFGSHGIIGAFILFKNKNNLEIKDLVISCRVLFRYLEDYIIYHILKNHKSHKYTIEYFKQNVNKHLIPEFLKKNYFTNISGKKNKFTYKIEMNKELENVKKFF